MADVFICYPENSEWKRAGKIASELEELGVSCWYAGRDMPKDTDALSVISKEIGRCRVFLVLLNKESSQSEQVKTEIRLAVEKYRNDKLSVAILPYRTKAFVLPDALMSFKAEFPFKTAPSSRTLAEVITHNLGRSIRRSETFMDKLLRGGVYFKIRGLIWKDVEDVIGGPNAGLVSGVILGLLGGIVASPLIIVIEKLGKYMYESDAFRYYKYGPYVSVDDFLREALTRNDLLFTILFVLIIAALSALFGAYWGAVENGKKGISLGAITGSVVGAVFGFFWSLILGCPGALLCALAGCFGGILLGFIGGIIEGGVGGILPGCFAGAFACAVSTSVFGAALTALINFI